MIVDAARPTGGRALRRAGGGSPQADSSASDARRRPGVSRRCPRAGGANYAGRYDCADLGRQLGRLPARAERQGLGSVSGSVSQFGGRRHSRSARRSATGQGTPSGVPVRARRLLQIMAPDTLPTPFSALIGSEAALGAFEGEGVL